MTHLIDNVIDAKVSDSGEALTLSMKFSALTQDGYLVTIVKDDVEVTAGVFSTYDQAAADKLSKDVKNTLGVAVENNLPQMTGARLSEEFRKIAVGDVEGFVPNEHDMAFQNDLQTAVQDLIMKGMYSFNFDMDTVVSEKPYAPKP